jgi:ATP-dependent Clp protease protease subunit
MKDTSELRVYINSPGGDVFDGVAIYNAIKRHPGKKTVCIDGIAASAASMIAMAGDDINIANNGMMMIHQAWGYALGNADDMRETADLLDKITNTSVLESYARTGLDREKLSALMKAETWMTADEAIEHGFADRKYEADDVKAAVAASLQVFKNTPASLKPASASRTADLRVAAMTRDLVKFTNRKGA